MIVPLLGDKIVRLMYSTQIRAETEMIDHLMLSENRCEF